MATIKLRRTNGGVGLEYDDIDNNFENLNNDILSRASKSGDTFTGPVNHNYNSNLGVPYGTTAQRGTPSQPAIRYNQSINQFEGFNGNSWENMSGGVVPNKNLIIGGDFTTNPWQRGTSIPVPSVSSLYTADRFVVTCSGGGAVTVSKQSDAPSFASSGVFSSSCLQCLVTTADTSLVTTDRYFVFQGIEGARIAKLGFGQAGTRFATLSFWVKSSVIGVYCVAFQNEATRSFIKEYTVNTANTWEKKVITIPVDSSGTWATDTSMGLGLQFMLAAGPSYAGVADTWQAGDLRVTANQVNFMATVGNSFKVDLIQLEAGSVDTPFETLDADAVALDCYRYFYRHSSGVGAYVEGVTSTAESLYMTSQMNFPTPMRTQPLANTSNANFSGSSRASFNSIGTSSIGAYILYSVSNGSTGFRAYGVMSAGFIDFNAEF